MIMVLDIDGTICEEDTPNVEERRPYLYRIQKINELYNAGNEIIYYTSRGMKSCNNDPTEAEKKYRGITEKQLWDWNAKYHRLVFGKPNADVYIDNKNILLEDFIKGFS